MSIAVPANEERALELIPLLNASYVSNEDKKKIEAEVEDLLKAKTITITTVTTEALDSHSEDYYNHVWN